MNDKKLKHLSRAELLELLLAQTKEAEQLQSRLQEVEKQLSEQNLKVQKAGDLAHAVLEVNNVMEVAQQSAQQYLDNIVLMEKETKVKCLKMIYAAKKAAKMIIENAKTEAKKFALEQRNAEISNATDVR